MRLTNLSHNFIEVSPPPKRSNFIKVRSSLKLINNLKPFDGILLHKGFSHPSYPTFIINYLRLKPKFYWTLHDYELNLFHSNCICDVCL